MANEEHLEMLKRGVTEWNEWRERHRKIRPDLGGADLCGANLYQDNFNSVNLASANLEGAILDRANLGISDLKGTNLSGASINIAVLNGARLNGATLTGAQLVGTTLPFVELEGADLSGTYLGGANFTDSNLADSNLANAHLDRTIFGGVDLRKAKGLEQVRHDGPSEISISTIYLSEGQIPEVFLRGCGLPDSFIIQIPALVAAMQPIQFYSCFISYSSKDEELAQRLYADLQSKGVRCWFAPEDLKIGERFRRRIDEVIRVYDRLLLILSEHSVASSWVEKEVEIAMESEDEQKRTILFPVRLDDAVMEIKTGWQADVRRTRHVGDFRRWKEHDEYQKAFIRLLADLKASA